MTDVPKTPPPPREESLCICEVASARRAGQPLPDIFHPPCGGTGFRQGTEEFFAATRKEPGE